MQNKLQLLADKEAQTLLGGGEDRIKKQHAAGKIFCLVFIIHLHSNYDYYWPDNDGIEARCGVHNLFDREVEDLMLVRTHADTEFVLCRCSRDCLFRRTLCRS